MISNELKCIFVHLRRTAGNSIEIALNGIALFDEIGNRTYEWQNHLHRGPKPEHKKDLRGHSIHSTAAQIRSLHPAEFEKYFKFSVVRNPWHQMRSHYFRMGWGQTDVSPSAANFKRWLKGYNQFQGTVPQDSLFEGDTCLVDHICRYENLQEDFNVVCKKLGIAPRQLPHANLEKSVIDGAIYDDESIALVDNMFRRDILRFGHHYI